MGKTAVSKATLSRLPDYHRILKDISSENAPYISATTISRMLGLGEVQVRKDLAAVSGEGKPKLGYETTDLIRKIEKCLCSEEVTKAVLVGAGKLGSALLQYDGFLQFGVRICSAFDSDEKEKTEVGSIPVLPIGVFAEFCSKENIRIGIITVSENAAQSICDLMVSCGITAIWNFAPCKLKVPDGILIQNENLALSLAHLNNQLCNNNQEDI